MVLTSPQAYNFNCAPQSSQYLYTVTFKLRYLEKTKQNKTKQNKKKLKLFSIRVKELFEPIVLRKKGLRVFALFLIAFSWETDLWVRLGDFTLKNAKLGEGYLYLTENWLDRNEIWYSEDDHI